MNYYSLKRNHHEHLPWTQTKLICDLFFFFWSSASVFSVTVLRSVRPGNECQNINYICSVSLRFHKQICSLMPGSVETSTLVDIPSFCSEHNLYNSCCLVQLTPSAYPVRVAHHYGIWDEILFIELPGIPMGMCAVDCLQMKYWNKVPYSYIFLLFKQGYWLPSFGLLPAKSVASLLAGSSVKLLWSCPPQNKKVNSLLGYIGFVLRTKYDWCVSGTWVSPDLFAVL